MNRIQHKSLITGWIPGCDHWNDTLKLIEAIPELVHEQGGMVEDLYIEFSKIFYGVEWQPLSPKVTPGFRAWLMEEKT